MKRTSRSGSRKHAPQPFRRRRLELFQLEDRVAPGDALSVLGWLLGGASLLMPQDHPLANHRSSGRPASVRPALTTSRTESPMLVLAAPTPAEGATRGIGIADIVLSSRTAEDEQAWHPGPQSVGLDLGEEPTDLLVRDLLLGASVRRLDTAARLVAEQPTAVGFDGGAPAAQGRALSTGIVSGPAGGPADIAQPFSQATLEALAARLQGASAETTGPVLQPGGGRGLTVLIHGDTNRDGGLTVDDLDGRGTFSATRGALFSPNYDDDDLDGHPDAVNINDQGRPFNEDRDVDNAADLLDLAPVVVKALGPGFTVGMRAFFYVPTKEDAQSVHVFPYGVGWPALMGGLGDRLTGGTPAAQLVEITPFVSATTDSYFGVESMFFRNTYVNPTTGQALTFDGAVDLFVVVFQGAPSIDSLAGFDYVHLTATPWMMLPHTQQSREVWAANYGTSNDEYLFTAAASPGYYGLDASGQLRTVTGSLAVSGTQWIQDHVEIGYTQRPGAPATQVTFRLPYYRGATVPQPAWVQQRLLRPDHNTFQIGVSHGVGAGDYGGNLEILPPSATNPLGKIILGNTGSTGLFTFLQSQVVQSPFRLPTSWLAVGHVDEYVGFTGIPNEAIIADPLDAYARMEAIPVADRGKAVFFATGQNPESGTATALGTTRRIYTGVDHRGQTWRYIRIYDSSTTGSGAAGQVARIATNGLQNGYVDVDLVWNTTSKVVDANPQLTTGASAMRWMLYANPPQATTWFATPRAGDKYVLVEGTRHWVGTSLPAIITVQEVLNDTLLRTLNTVDVQGTLNTVRSTLTAQNGAPMTFYSAPTLFVGRRTSFATNRNSVAFTVGMANFHPLGGDYYFPRQFGPRDASGQDIFEAAAYERFPNARFVDVWDLYHRLLGELHCGSVVMREPYSFGWWDGLQ